jgi:hypothetical protein
MTEVTFGRLSDLVPREAWKDEAKDFTPWLAANIDQISEAIGITLELTGTEMPVETFSADILARNADDGTAVLIENQLEQTDHTHLGQIMTYLAGLEARTVIWIAPKFREPHLAAIRWLNEHTSEDFGFFAIRLRVVRIGDSPFAPIFEVEEKPSGWQKQLSRKRREVETGTSEESDRRHAFWLRYLERYPGAAKDGVKESRAWNQYFMLAGGDIQVSVYVAQQHSGVYVKGGWSENKHRAEALLSAHEASLVDRLGALATPGNTHGHYLSERFPQSYLDHGNWDAIIDWMEERRLAYTAAIRTALGETE